MSLRTPIRTSLLFAALAPIAFAQNAQPPDRTPAVPPVQQNPKPATVSFAEGRISVSAENASLNQILHAISDKTGMKITGGVRDERVYGNYGPAAPAVILAQLLTDTGSNMLLVQSANAAPSELILTPRNGGPTPPSPNGDSSSSYAPPRGDNPRAPIGSRVIMDRRAPNRPTPPAINGGNGGPQSSVQQPSGNSQDPSANPQQPPARTPQQIFNDIQEQRRQQLQNGDVQE